MPNDLKTCAICGDEFTGWGNNPEPFKGKTCCDDCNDRFVVPTRMCLGRGFGDESIMLLLTTIAELGKAIRRVNAEAMSMRDKGGAEKISN